ncbi:MAG: hypothetical protein JST92_17030 [Deltaproteobacteria bacterium]|nr:hypothetical protein [Deltaproteobacteria bacterium]
MARRTLSQTGPLLARLAFVAAVLLAQGARAQDAYPSELVQRPLVLPDGMVEFNANLGIDLSKDQFFNPVSVAPGVRIGLAHRLELDFTTDPFGLFPPGSGLCAGDACGHAWNGAYVGLAYNIGGSGPFQAALHGAFGFTAFDPVILGTAVGVKLRLQSGLLAVVFDPTLGIGLTHRDTFGDSLNLPLEVQFQTARDTALRFITGLNGPLDSFGDRFAIPLAVGVFFNVQPRFDVGAQAGFTNLLGRGGGLDGREVSAVANLRL